MSDYLSDEQHLLDTNEPSYIVGLNDNESNNVTNIDTPLDLKIKISSKDDTKTVSESESEIESDTTTEDKSRDRVKFNVLCVESKTNQLLGNTPETLVSGGEEIGLKGNVDKLYKFDSLGVFEYIDPAEYESGVQPSFYSGAEDVISVDAEDLSCLIEDTPSNDMTVVFYMADTVSQQLDIPADSGLELPLVPGVFMIVMSGFIGYLRRKQVM